MPLAAADHDAEHSSFEAPDLTAQSIMLVSPQSIEASLIARRLQRWGGQTCMVSDVAVAQALLPERSWHAVLLDHALGAADIELLGDAARPHATQRIVMFTPATRHELQPSSTSSAFTGYLVKPLRAASLAARLTTAPEVAAPELAVETLVESLDPAETPATVPAARGLSILVAEDNEINALLMRSLLSRLGHHAVITHQWRRSAGILARGAIRRCALRSGADGHPDAATRRHRNHQADPRPRSGTSPAGGRQFLRSPPTRWWKIATPVSRPAWTAS